MFKLSKSEQLKKDIILVDQYFTQAYIAKTCNISVNTMIKLRRAAGLKRKTKGRPKELLLFKGETPQYPQEVIEALERMPKLMEYVRTLGAELETEEIE